GLLSLQNRRLRGCKIRSSWERVCLIKVVLMFVSTLSALVSKADCYVELKLPTASPIVSRTQVVDNSDNPEWNETFQYRIHSAVKNILELTLYDKDVLVSDELTSIVFDVGGMKLGQPLLRTFRLNPEVSPWLPSRSTVNIILSSICGTGNFSFSKENYIDWLLLGYFKSCLRSDIKHLQYAVVGGKMAGSMSLKDKGNELRVQSAEIINGRKHKASCRSCLQRWHCSGI
uniref:C2 domain-containing protein n=1 Tax=Accipiter nisus TaxID=211598 RepID=A0A8B9MKT2_9AVES